MPRQEKLYFEEFGSMLSFCHIGVHFLWP